MIRTFTGVPQAELPDPTLERCSSCFFPTEFHHVPLINVRPVSHDTKVYTFGLPPRVSLSLPVCACILLQGYDANGQPVVRPYTPISSNHVTGQFDLLVKHYDKGVVSQWLASQTAGTLVAFKHIPFNIKAQYPFTGRTKLNMICGGTGVTPMYQALLELASNPSDALQVTCLIANKAVTDILLREELEAIVKQSNGRIKVVHVIGDRPDQPPIPGWGGEVGWVDEAKIQKYCFKPDPDVLTLVCGVPPLYHLLCGPRTDPQVKEGTVLHRLGYTDDMVSKM